MWRNNVDKDIKGHLERVINDTVRYRQAVRQAENPGNAQLWIAIANLSKQIFDINLKLNYLERALRDSLGRRETSVAKKESKVKKSLKKY